MGDDVKQWMDEIIDSVKATKSSDFEIVFDPTLVRGMSYYTGTIFEIAILNLAEAAVAVVVMTRWLVSSQVMMYRHVVFQLDLKELFINGTGLQNP